MYGRIAGVLFPVLAVGVIGAGMWGYQENKEKNSVLIKAENQYQRAFHNLNYHMDRLQDELGKTMAVNSRQQLTPSLTNVWRLAYSAQNDVSQLPLTLMPFNHTEKFLANVADFSYQTAVRDLDREPLSKQEYDTLRKLYAHSKDIHSDLQKVQSTIMTKQLRWMDVETALASEHNPQDNTIVDGLKVIDKSVEGYKDVEFGSGIGSLNASRKLKIQSMKGQVVSADEAKKKALAFVELPATAIKQVTVTDNGKTREYESYSVRIERKDQKTPVFVDISKKGGHVIWVLDERDIGKHKISMGDAQRRADEYLKRRGYTNMEAMSYDDYKGVAAFTYVCKQGDVRLYPDTVTVKIALDNGTTTGFQGESYLLNHRVRTIPKAKVSQAQARKRLNPAFAVKEVHKAIIEDERGKEVYAYEFYGSIGQETYRIYIDTQTGQEVKVEKIKAGMH